MSSKSVTRQMTAEPGFMEGWESAGCFAGVLFPSGAEISFHDDGKFRTLKNCKMFCVFTGGFTGLLPLDMLYTQFLSLVQSF